jgi:hypothetical protein
MARPATRLATDQRADGTHPSWTFGRAARRVNRGDARAGLRRGRPRRLPGDACRRRVKGPVASRSPGLAESTRVRFIVTAQRSRAGPGVVSGRRLRSAVMGSDPPASGPAQVVSGRAVRAGMRCSGACWHCLAPSGTGGGCGRGVRGVKRELGHEVLREFGPVSSGYHGHPRDFGVPGLGVRVEKSWRRQGRPAASSRPAGSRARTAAPGP